MASPIRPRSGSFSEGVVLPQNISPLRSSKSESDLQALQIPEAAKAEASKLESLNENDQTPQSCSGKCKERMVCFKDLVVFFFKWLWGKFLKIFCCRKDPKPENPSDDAINLIGRRPAKKANLNEQPLPPPSGQGLDGLPPASSSSSSSSSSFSSVIEESKDEDIYYDPNEELRNSSSSVVITSSSSSSSTRHIQKHPDFLTLSDKETRVFATLLTTLADVKLQMVRFTVASAKKNITSNPLKYIGYCIKHFNNELNAIAAMKAHPKRWPNFVADFGERMLKHKTVQQLAVITQFCEYFNLVEGLVVTSIGECERAPAQHNAWSGFIKKLQDAIVNKQGEFYQAPQEQSLQQQPVVSLLSSLLPPPVASSSSLQSSSSSSSSSVIPVLTPPSISESNKSSAFFDLLTEKKKPFEESKEQEGIREKENKIIRERKARFRQVMTTLATVHSTMGNYGKFMDLDNMRDKLEETHPLTNIGWYIQKHNPELLAIKASTERLPGGGPFRGGGFRWDTFAEEWGALMAACASRDVKGFNEKIFELSDCFSFSTEVEDLFSAKIQACLQLNKRDKPKPTKKELVEAWGGLIEFLQSKIHPSSSNSV